jgi:hypothetical protein
MSFQRYVALGDSFTEAAPWVHRRLIGRSSGDQVAPKRPGLAPV